MIRLLTAAATAVASLALTVPAAHAEASTDLVLHCTPTTSVSDYKVRIDIVRTKVQHLRKHRVRATVRVETTTSWWVWAIQEDCRALPVAWPGEVGISVRSAIRPTRKAALKIAKKHATTESRRLAHAGKFPAA